MRREIERTVNTTLSDARQEIFLGISPSEAAFNASDLIMRRLEYMGAGIPLITYESEGLEAIVKKTVWGSITIRG